MFSQSHARINASRMPLLSAPSSSTYHSRHTVAGLALIALVALILLLAGCGQAGVITSPSPTPIPTHGNPITGTAVRSCVGPVVSAASVGTVAHVLTSQQSGTTVNVRQGELVQVQLPATFHWSFNNQAGNLVVVPPLAGQDPTLNVCFWTFRAQSAGTVTLHFSGAPPCDPSVQICSQIAILQTYTIVVA